MEVAEWVAWRWLSGWRGGGWVVAWRWLGGGEVVAGDSRRGQAFLGLSGRSFGLVARRSKGTPPRWANHAEIGGRNARGQWLEGSGSRGAASGEQREWRSRSAALRAALRGGPTRAPTSRRPLPIDRSRSPGPCGPRRERSQRGKWLRGQRYPKPRK